MYNDYDALIFDMDGTIVDSGRLHENAWTLALQSYDIPVDPALMRKLAGVPTLQTVEHLIEHFQLPLSHRVNDIADHKERLVEQDSADFVRATSLLEVAERYYQKKPMAIGTGASTAEARHLLKACKIAHLFDEIVGADQVTKHKPAPDTFLRAAALMKVAPERCVVFEDSPLGIQAAKDAGMGWVDVQNELGIINSYFLDSQSASIK